MFCVVTGAREGMVCGHTAAPDPRPRHSNHQRGSFLFLQAARMSHRRPGSVGTGASEPSTDGVWPEASRAHQRDKSTPQIQWQPSASSPTWGPKHADWPGRASYERVGVEGRAAAEVAHRSPMKMRLSLRVRRAQRALKRDGQRNRTTVCKVASASATSANHCPLLTAHCTAVLLAPPADIKSSSFRSPGSRYARRHMIEHA